MVKENIPLDTWSFYCFFFNAFRRDASSINLDSPWAGRPDPLDEEAEPPHPLTLEVEPTKSSKSWD